MKHFIAINLNEYHENQQPDARTNATIRFVGAQSLDDAKRCVAQWWPESAWTVIPKQTIDRNIVPMEAIS